MFDGAVLFSNHVKLTVSKDSSWDSVMSAVLKHSKRRIICDDPSFEWMCVIDAIQHCWF